MGALALGILSLLILWLPLLILPHPLISRMPSRLAAMYLTPLAGLAGLALGIFSLARRRSGKAIAIVGAATGLSGVAWLPLALTWVLVVPSLFATEYATDRAGSSELERRSMCQSRLNSIGLAVEMYRHANTRQPPATLDVLVAQVHLSPEELKCPSAWQRSRIDYFYFPCSDDSSSSALMACDAKGNHGDEGRNVLYAGGRVTWLSESAFQAELAKPMNAFLAKAITQAEAQIQPWTKPDDPGVQRLLIPTRPYVRKETAE